ncbi:3-phosphoserine/phosphohydroxythreonine transaminase [Caenimonas koreensis]|uniref:Phosphoserine aminotransferase n=1 Tax=Caenimonas koreensis DSM 17982 TaxID=1121255 RepID=A0A844ATI3_9BURK|nr:3-phosphoserine/phosphohydroxythreonine transaminase [Caenimonas koreensis]MRD47780.1 3-phosphoserine/phosphohydroxythreonine transaminase [Caenimonas koreensis DSM 17982]
MTRVFNFSPGPATLPEPVLRKAAQEMLDWHGSGMSVMEMSHRGKQFISIYDEAQALARELLAVPANYKVLFMQGGAIGENAIVPMNLIGKTGKADYVLTGDWSQRSFKEAQTFGTINIAATGEGDKFRSIPKQSTWKLDPQASYVHICSNETIGGVEYHWTPDTGSVPLVADMSSNLMSRPLDVSKYGLIYAGAQKNMGPSGLTIVIVRDDLLGHALPITPSAFNYQLQAEADSMFNTPPTYAIYIAGLVFNHIKAQGGLAAMQVHNEAKAAVLYDFLDESKFFYNSVAREDRSLMNVPFKLKDESLDEAFLQGAADKGMIQLKGHRISGGMRASIYNAMPIEGVKALVAYMKDFEVRHG